MAKPKPKSPEEKQAALDQMLSMAATTNHMTGTGTVAAPIGTEGGQAATPAPRPTPTKEEQKGENASVSPAAETRAPAAKSAPALVTPVPATALEPEPTAAAELVPTPTPEPAPTPTPKLQERTEPAPVAAAPKPETVPPEEFSTQAVPESTTTVEMATVELASLFIPSADKKTFTMRLTDAHYQYLLLLGTIVGNGTSPPDIVHNILAHFIDRNDAQIQKSIAKQLRQRQRQK